MTLGSSCWFGVLVCCGTCVRPDSRFEEASFLESRGACGAGRGFLLGWGVGEGSVHVPTKLMGVVVRPRSVSTGEGVHLVALGRLILRGIGVSGPLTGVDPETVCFLPVVGVEKISVVGVCTVKERPSSSATVKRYLAFLLRTAAEISASWVAVHFSICSIFQRRHFSSTSAVAALAAFWLKLSLRVTYHSLYPS